ncbi:tetratricopeptide repeat protein [candidate division WOR-3 bacterium]|nr:tetratricopeptide repeat protein [candidate division WOR-3 bacterium]
MIFRLSLIISLVASVCVAGNLQQAGSLYEQGTRNYNITTLKSALSLLTEIESGQEFDFYLLQGKCYARIQLVYKIKDNVSSSETYGKKSLEALEKAIDIAPNSIEVWAAHSIALQNLTGLGTAYGMKYGPMLSQGMNQLKKLDPDHFCTRFVDGVWKLRAPLMFGGDRKKALETFSTLHKSYPDDEDVSLNLAVAYIENNLESKARILVASVLGTNPNNLWAAKLTEEFD